MAVAAVLGQVPADGALIGLKRRRDDVEERMEQSFDPRAMVLRFRQRAEAVRSRPLPPVEGAERQRFREQAQQDFMDFAMIGDAEVSLDDGVLHLRIDLRPAGRRP